MARVLVPLAEGFEEVEAVTVIDLLRRAGIQVVSAGLESGPVTASRGVVIVPDADLDTVMDDHFDMVVLPGGGPGADRLDRDPRIRALLQRMADAGKYTAAICAAPKVLGHAGLLTGRAATSFPGALDGVEVPGILYREDPVVVDGPVITSRGPGTAMDFTLTLIEHLAGAERRRQVESGLQRP
ncbi:MAG: DJ-1 family protein [Chromatiales bacterium 21-64-14]|nr:MAG: DJ-1 family protein [Chromatiales bacterium 21-64-14]HQU14542.1 DJ-1/PfpI family protein [Gammaproteobacteria bacterium]